MAEPEITKEEFCARFKARMIAEVMRLGGDIEGIPEYADKTGPVHWDDVYQRQQGPEACADEDMSYWGD